MKKRGLLCQAVKLGYRHIDCAQGYMNQPEIGRELNAILNQKKLIKVSGRFTYAILCIHDSIFSPKRTQGFTKRLSMSEKRTACDNITEQGVVKR